VGEHYHDYDGFVVLHGTDTMAFTASVLSFLFSNLGKPVVMTGSQLPLIDERTDARTNLANALRIAGGHRTQPGDVPLIPEVVLCFGTELLRGNRSRKMSTTDLNGFESPNYPHLGALGEQIEIQRRLLLPRPRPPQRFSVDTRLEPGVIDFTFFPGVTADLLEAVLIRSEVKGAVIRTFGAGNAMTHPDILDVFQEAVARGVVLMNVTQCPHGRVDMGLYDTGAGLRQLGIIGGLDITPEAALAKMLWVLGSQRSPRARRAALLRNLRGEQSPA
jgi:L-asparaginase